MTLWDVCKRLRACGLRPHAYRVPMSVLRRLHMPVLAVMRFRRPRPNEAYHYVAVFGIDRRNARGSDSSGRTWVLPTHEFADLWSGIVVSLSPLELTTVRSGTEASLVNEEECVCESRRVCAR